MATPSRSLKRRVPECGRTAPQACETALSPYVPEEVFFTYRVQINLEVSLPGERRRTHALREANRPAGQRKGQSAQARPGDLPSGVQLRRGAVRRGGSPPPGCLERRRAEVREERRRQVGREGRLKPSYLQWCTDDRAIPRSEREYIRGRRRLWSLRPHSGSHRRRRGLVRFRGVKTRSGGQVSEVEPRDSSPRSLPCKVWGQFARGF